VSDQNTGRYLAFVYYAAGHDAFVEALNHIHPGATHWVDTPEPLCSAIRLAFLDYYLARWGLREPGELP
jgi:hypothetical protein